MILLVHMLFGAVIATIFKNPFLAIILAYFGHYILDFIPHIEYSIKNFLDKKISLDFFIGLSLVFLFSNNQPITYICVFFALLPDGLSVLEAIFKNNKILQKHSNFHQIKLHYFKNQKISNFWRFLSQIMVVLISITLLQR